jgi:hypothetical protein
MTCVILGVTAFTIRVRQVPWATFRGDSVYQFLDVFLLVFHAALVLFNVTAWAWRRTRRAHLVTISATILSWTALGLFYGFGYCPLTDWHWDVKRALGERDLPNSYIAYYLERAGLDWDPSIVDAVVLVVTLTAFALSIWLTVRDARARRKRLISESGDTGGLSSRRG